MKIGIVIKSIIRFIYPFNETKRLEMQLDKTKKQLYYTLGVKDFYDQKFDFENRYKEIESKTNSNY